MHNSTSNQRPANEGSYGAVCLSTDPERPKEREGNLERFKGKVMKAEPADSGVAVKPVPELFENSLPLDMLSADTESTVPCR
jgi:hypothetical protein